MKIAIPYRRHFTISLAPAVDMTTNGLVPGGVRGHVSVREYVDGQWRIVKNPDAELPEGGFYFSSHDQLAEWLRLATKPEFQE